MKSVFNPPPFCVETMSDNLPCGFSKSYHNDAILGHAFREPSPEVQTFAETMPYANQ
jgi:hypothetical protein